MRASLLSGFALASLATASAGQAASYTCAGEGAEQTTILKTMVVGIVAGADTKSAEKRTNYDLPQTTPDKVVVITGEPFCSRAGAAYHAATRPPGNLPNSRTLVVLLVNGTRYVVRDPADGGDGFEATVVFDKNWAKIVGVDGKPRPGA